MFQLPRSSASKLAWLFLLAAAPNALLAQLPAARLSAVCPSGGKSGTTFDVTIAGSDLDEVTKLHFSHPGITATQKTTPPGPADKGPQPVANQFSVAIAADVPPAMYEARAIGRYGISSPRAFTVGELPELIEQGANNSPAQALEVPLGATVNGQANAQAYDYYKFSAQKDQRIVIDCWAQRIDSRMDATLAVYDAGGKELATSRDVNRRDPLVDVQIPADGVYTIRVHDFIYAGGPEYFYRLNIGTAPYIDFIFPPAGQPGTTGKFTLFGRNLPGGTAVAGLAIEGRPLEQLPVDITVPGGAAAQQLNINGMVDPEGTSIDGFEYRLKSAQGTSNPVLIGIAAAAVVAEQEPNNDPAKAQKVALPCEFVGQFNPRGDRDWFTFEAKKGDVYTLEVISQRQGVATDPQMIVQRVQVNDKGVETVTDLQEADDLATSIGGNAFNTRTDDPSYRFVAPDNGTYRILIADLYQRGNPRYTYRVSIHPELPDFRLVAVPLFVNPQQNNQAQAGVPLLRKGGHASVNVLCFRRDGFAEEVTVSATGLPAGVTCPDVVLGPGQNAAALVFSAADDAAEWAGPIQIVGKSKIAGAEVVREARPGNVVWPSAPQVQNASPDARLARDLALAVSGHEAAPYTVKVAEAKVWEMSRAGKLEIPIKVTRRGDFKGALAMTAAGLPPNAKVNNFNIDGNTTEMKVQLELPNNTPVGTFTFYLNAQSQVSYKRNPQAQAAAEAAKKEVDALLAKANEEAKKATQAKAEADKLATEAAAQIKKTADARAAADKLAVDSMAAAKAALEKAQQAKAAAEKEAANPALQEAKAAAEKAAAEAEGKAKAAAEAQAAAVKAMAEADAKAKATTEAKAAADKAAAEAAEKVKAITAAQAAAAKRMQDAANLSKANNVNAIEPSSTIVVKVTPAPITLAAPAEAAKIKQGEKLEVPLTITRLYGYKDPVEVEAVVPQGVANIKIAKVTIPADQTAGKLTFEAAANATAGNHTFTLRATAKFNGQNLPVDQPLPVMVEAVQAAKK